MGQVAGPQPLGKERFDVPADELVGLVSEHVDHAARREDDLPVARDSEDRVGRAVDERAELLLADRERLLGELALGGDGAGRGENLRDVRDDLENAAARSCASCWTT